MKTVHKKVTRTTALNILLPHENRENLNNLFRRYSQKSSSNSNSISSVGDGGAQVSAAAADAFFLAAAMGAGLLGMVTSDSDWCQKNYRSQKDYDISCLNALRLTFCILCVMPLSMA